MIKFDYEEEKSMLLSQTYAGDDVDVEILDEVGEVDYSFRIPQDALLSC